MRLVWSRDQSQQSSIFMYIRGCKTMASRQDNSYSETWQSPFPLKKRTLEKFDSK